MATRTRKPRPVMTDEQQQAFFSLMKQVRGSLEEEYEQSEEKMRDPFSVYRAGVDGILQFFLNNLSQCFSPEVGTAFETIARSYDRAWKGKPYKKTPDVSAWVVSEVQ